MAQLFPRLTLTAAEAKAVVKLLFLFSNDRSSIVKTMTMQALTDIVVGSRHLVPEVKRHIQELSVTGTPAMKARSKTLLRTLAEARDG